MVIKLLLTFCFLWTLVNLYIGTVVDPAGAPKWMKWSMFLWVASILTVLVIACIGYIWSL